MFPINAAKKLEMAAKMLEGIVEHNVHILVYPVYS